MVDIGYKHIGYCGGYWLSWGYNDTMTEPAWDFHKNRMDDISIQIWWGWDITPMDDIMGYGAHNKNGIV